MFQIIYWLTENPHKWDFIVDDSDNLFKNVWNYEDGISRMKELADPMYGHALVHCEENQQPHIIATCTQSWVIPND